METFIWQTYQDQGIIMLGIINTSNQNQINNFVQENSITFPILFDAGSSGGVQGGYTYDDYYMPNDGSPYPRDFVINQDGVIAYANNEIDTEWMIYVINELINTNSGQMGDINEDSMINVLDIVSLINIILGTADANDYQLWSSDLNEDQNINILDVVILVNYIMGESSN